MPTFQGVVNEEGLLQLDRVREVAPSRRSGREIAMPTLAGSAASLPERRLRHQVVAADARSQAHRAPVPGGRHGVLLRRRRVRRADPARPGDAGRRSRLRRDLQQALHHARRDDGVLLPDSRHPVGARQLPRAHHDRRQGSGLSKAEPRELVHLHARRAVHLVRARHRRRRHRLDLLCPLQHRLVDDERHSDGARHLHHRLFVDSDRPQLHRHDSPHARARA